MPHCRSRQRYVRCSLGLGALALVACVPALAASAPDVRILIDVSGSMQQNDPHQLRVPALRLLTDLLPMGSRAGVWVFDEAVEPLAPPAAVDAAWKDRARTAARRVDSLGRYTDIEAALEVATADWTGAAGAASPRHVLLLTDGMVDVAKDPAASAASRERVLGPQLARLRGLGARVHTVALSAHADHALLEALAAATGGWSEAVDDAAALERAFLHLFEQAAAPESLPLAGKRFTVDASVRELTLLVFRVGGGQPLALTDPAGHTHTGSAHAESMRWRSEGDYDLVTIAEPAAGEWRFDGSDDPDNRALIVTDLALDTDELPAHVVPGEPLALRASVTEHGVAVARRDFLELLGARADVTGGDAALTSATLTLDAAGAFTGSLATRLPAGDYELTIAIDGGTFARQRRHRFRVHPAPLSLSHETRAPGEPARRIALGVTAVPGAVDPESVAGLVVVTGPGGARSAHELPPLVDGSATVEIPAGEAGDYLIEPWLLATSSTGRSLSLRPAPIAVSFADGASPLEAPAPTPLPWLTAATVVGAGNAGLGTALGGLWWLARRRRDTTPEPAL